MAETICLPGIEQAYLLFNMQCINCKCEIQDYLHMCYFREQTCDKTHINPSYMVNIIARDGSKIKTNQNVCCNAIVDVKYLPIGIDLPSKKYFIGTRGPMSNTSSLDSPSISGFTQSGSLHGYYIHVSLTILLAITLVAAILYIVVGKFNDSKRRSSVNNPTFSEEHNQQRILATNTSKSSEYFTIDEIGAVFCSSSSTNHASGNHNMYESTPQAALPSKRHNNETETKDEGMRAVRNSYCILESADTGLKKKIENSVENDQETEPSEEEPVRNDDNDYCLPIEIANSSTYDTTTDQDDYFVLEKLKGTKRKGKDEENIEQEVTIKGEKEF